MGSSTSTKPASSTNTGPCPKGFGEYNYNAYWWWQTSVHTCTPPTSGFDARAVPVGSSNSKVGSCSGSRDTPPSAAPDCDSGFTSVATSNEYCCSGFTSCDYSNANGKREQRACKQSNGPKIFEAWSRNVCYEASRGGVNSGWIQNQWCNGASGRNNEGHCWLPYHLTANSMCFANDRVNTGQFTSTGARQAGSGVAEYLINGSAQTWTTSFTPPKVPNQTNGAAVAGTAAGGTVAGAAVVGIVLFNKKRALKQAPGLEMQPKFATAV